MLGLWLALTAGVMITSHITRARGDKPSRALWEAIVANLIFGGRGASGKQDMAALRLCDVAAQPASAQSQRV
jgi:hypothetical protein